MYRVQLYGKEVPVILEEAFLLRIMDNMISQKYALIFIWVKNFSLYLSRNLYITTYFSEDLFF